VLNCFQSFSVAIGAARLLKTKGLVALITQRSLVQIQPPQPFE
jgi:hypothetical protein